jgi:hypothetical protein
MENTIAKFADRMFNLLHFINIILLLDDLGCIGGGDQTVVQALIIFIGP